MDKYKCKLCYRSFNNGRALGGHMRSHMMNLLVTKQEEESSRTVQLSFEAESAPSSSSSSEDDDVDEKGLNYGLRENPKRSIRLVDQEFSFPQVDTSSVILQDIESETESSKNNPTRKRSKRVWKIRGFDQKYYNESATKKMKFFNKNDSSVVEHEPVSSVSDATTEEDVAFCLMQLSRDKWNRQNEQYEDVEDEDDDDEAEEEEEEEDEIEIERSLEDSDESQELLKVCKNNNKVRKGRYKCETCNKVFKSYQALGGHRASHKKIKPNITVEESSPEFEIVEKKVHECPVCFRVFNSGQALGGHKRTHVIHGSSSTTVPIFSSKRVTKSVIDLNLPAPIDDDEVSQIENSAVSDAEFLKTR
ncbi:putative transcription factor C2H2 family [Medicago truncatula]|uniref:C2H2-type zinc finger protein, putative n=2 Tax=Medicago truncatula TaxID=3880 RepID=A0A072THU2_MEDTR|nr:zinc finger protein ZAT9 isoform X2 [Medicago truncatula]KEH16508.1 C2H2-type zinc finger protein, putative [Medicago truncatula]RHN45436.1 putative transcription factor C2H2 family [Medicago truncatula]